MRPSTRKLVLIAHVATSVGWLGAVAAFVALAAHGLLPSDPEQIRASYVAARIIGWFVIVPASFACLVTGIVQSLGTEWGLVRHYWILIKLVLNVLACGVLMIHMAPIDRVAAAAATMPLGSRLHDLRVQLLVDALAASAVLLVAIALSIVKPRGITPFGRSQPTDTPS